MRSNIFFFYGLRMYAVVYVRPLILSVYDQHPSVTSSLFSHAHAVANMRRANSQLERARREAEDARDRLLAAQASSNSSSSSDSSVLGCARPAPQGILSHVRMTA